MLGWLDPETPFPHPSRALPEPDGLLCAGGDLSVPRLVSAYRNGIFPWYERGQPILWWSPSLRCVLPGLAPHISRSMKRVLNKNGWHYRFDQDFDAVIRACQAPRHQGGGTWITTEMRSAYNRLHAAGFAHSIEVMEGEQLIGGLYGVAMGSAFFGESMFSRRSNASKAAFIVLARHLRVSGFQLFDCQVSNPHLMSLGAVEWPREHFLEALATAIDQTPKAETWKIKPESLH